MNKEQCLHILGVLDGDTETVIKKAFRKKAKLLHPDVNKSKDATEQFRKLNQAYENLLTFKNEGISDFRVHQNKRYQKPSYSEDYYEKYYKNYNSFYKSWFAREEKRRSEEKAGKQGSYWQTKSGQKVSNKSIHLLKNLYFFSGLVIILLFVFYFLKYGFFFIRQLFIPDGSGLAIILAAALLVLAYVIFKTYKLIKSKA